MSNDVNRRYFLGASAVAGLAAHSALAAPPPNANETLRVGVMGTGGRGRSLAISFQRQQNVRVDYVCDVDSGRANGTAQAVNQATNHRPNVVTDYRRILDDNNIDILVVATCNHWHAPGAIAACNAGKHVYVEKPCSHNPHEGELMVQAARKHQRKVQMGAQRRSYPKIIEAIQQVHKNVIGRPYLAQCWYQNNRPSIGRGQAAAVPQGLDYNLWQGPAPRRPFRNNYLHYNWHWFWHWGNGELGNNGIHMIDLCRWGLQVDYPIHVTSSGGRYRYQDDQETPDTHIVNFEFEGRKQICWEGLSCNRLARSKPADVIFYGERGTLVIQGNGYTIYDVAGKQLRQENGTGNDAVHIGNFLDAVRGNGNLSAEIAEGHKSTLLCHLGNIAHRTGRALRCNANDGRIQADKQAMSYWRREYNPAFEPRVT